MKKISAFILLRSTFLLLFAVVDCNNFFVSCERVFRPDLKDKPVAVLSNNDGCFVARSNEVKALGIPMAAPLFEYQSIVKKHNVVLFSANFSLYADISERVMNIIQRYAPYTEVYSIDEAFIDFGNVGNRHAYSLLYEFCTQLRKTILQWTGIPVSVGIAKTKTLAKIANEYAKKKPEYNGAFQIPYCRDKACLVPTESETTILQSIPVKHIWGVGFQLSDLLNRYSIYNALELKEANEKFLKQHSSINLQRTVLELRGIPCYPLQPHKEAAKSVTTSRTFVPPIETLNDLKEAVASYVSRAAEKLRHDRLITSHMTLYLRTNRHKSDEPQYRASQSIQLSSPSAYTPFLVSKAFELLTTLFRSGYRYKQAGIVFHGLVPRSIRQAHLFDQAHDYAKENRLMETIDFLNDKWGSTTISLAATGKVNRLWSSVQSQQSPHYTTDWNSLPIVHF